MTFVQQQAAGTFFLGDSLRERSTQANREDVSEDMHRVVPLRCARY